MRVGEKTFVYHQTEPLSKPYHIVVVYVVVNVLMFRWRPNDFESIASDRSGLGGPRYRILVVTREIILEGIASQKMVAAVVLQHDIIAKSHTPIN